MPLFSDTASAIKSRFGFSDRVCASSSSTSDILTTMPSVKSTPDLYSKSALKDTARTVNRTLSTGGLDFHEDDYSTTSHNRDFAFHEDPSFWKDHNVQVIIRIRPLNSTEISVQGQNRCIRQDSSQTITWTGHPESRFTFDLVADENVSQEMLFKVAGVPMVENCMGGYNSCMFAYGQTGSGKTHTMLGDIEGGTRRHSINCGMTPRVFEFLFSRIQKEREVRRDEKIKFTCRCSFLEIYNEQILDLLDPSSSNLQIREDSKKGIHVENLTEVEVGSARDVIQQLLQGTSNRKVAATNMNLASSRSHSVFTCTIESKWESQGVTHHRFARLNLVDLAGSERQKTSGAEGERLKEATNINKSLSTLGLVIMNLVNISNGKSLHVPYRDSKLTFLLQDSLGGNAKTIIIANISPSSCCSLETLSTLKFAQRAKYIKNHAIVNEDASGDVLAMRIQIQNLKKEISRLRSHVNGGVENHESDALIVSFPGYPGTPKWEGLHGPSSPLISDKRISLKEYEVALVGAFRREKDKDTALQALVAENQAAMQLAKQREDEIQSLKMRLRFREAGIKRLEAVAYGKISAESHLLQEKVEHLKEIEVLRSQVDRNKEATRFAMENLRLKEEIRRLKTFCEEGERERMHEQIETLQNKLLEALDWKLMHESDPSESQNGNTNTKISSDDDMLLFGHGSASPWRTSLNEENEFLRVQAIQNQSELDSLRKKFDLCVEEKEKLQRYVNELEMQMEAVKSSKAVTTQATLKEQIELPSLISSQMPNIVASDQIELKTMVDAIAAASHREAEAHETAIFLSKENDELKMKLKVLLEDNNKLIELYEHAVAESNINCRSNQNGKEQPTEDGNGLFNRVLVEQDLVMKTEVENLKNQLREMHDENEKLMGLYEKAMKERDEFKRLFAASNDQKNSESRGEFNCREKLVEIDRGDHLKLDEPFVSAEENSRTLEAGFAPQLEEEYAISGAEGLRGEAGLHEVNVQEWYPQYSVVKTVEPRSEEFSHSEGEEFKEKELSGQSAGKLVEEVCCHEGHENFKSSSGDHQSVTEMEIDTRSSVDIELVRKKVVEAQEKLASSVKMMGIFGSLERSLVEIEELSAEIQRVENNLDVKQQECATYKLLYSEEHERRVLLERKLKALEYSLSSFSTSINYFEQREAQARARLDASTTSLNRKKDELVHLQVQKDEILKAKMKIKQAEVELKSNLADLKSKLEEETRKLENDRVLLAIDNVEKAEVGQALQRNWHLGGKATELLKSEEEKTKLQNEMKRDLERLGVVKKEYEELKKKLGKAEKEILVVEKEMENGRHSVEEMNQKLQNVIKEKKMVLDMKERGRKEFEYMFVEYHQSVIEAALREEEMRISEEELLVESRKIEDLQREKATAASRKSQLLEEMSCRHSCLVSDKIQEDLHSIRMYLADLGDRARQR